MSSSLIPAPGGGENTQVAPARRRPSWLLPVAILLLMALTAGATWAIAQRTQSPQQVQAAAQAPAPEAITATLTRGPLEDTTTARVAIGPAQTQQIVLPTREGARVVTGNPLSAGTPIGIGQPLIELNGRPVFAVLGTFPYYRDLAVGDTGPDVEQWQQTLRDLGYSIPSSEYGRVGARTATATEKFYAARDYPALKPDSAAEQPAASNTPTAAGAAAPAASPNAAAAGPVTGDLVLPMAEVVVVPGGDQRLQSVPAVGTTLAEDATLSLAGADLAATSSVPAIDAPALAEGMAVTITPDAGEVRTGVLGAVPAPAAAPAEADATTTGQVPLVTIPVSVEGGIPPEWEGKNFILTIIKQRVADDAILVPSTAITTDATGSAIYVRQSDGSFARVSVSVAGTVRGVAAVAPDEASGVVEGAVVRIG